MSKSSLLHPKVAERIARTYVEKYSRIGFGAASAYVEQAVGNNPIHIAQVREIVIDLLNPLRSK